MSTSHSAQDELILDAAASEFGRHVAKGLSAAQPYLSSKFIYDAAGSKLFQQIMQLDSYYLTRCEFEIFSAFAKTLHAAFSDGGSIPYELVELGAGDGAKTKLLLAEAMAAGGNFVYRPVDISAAILQELETSLHEQWPQMRVDGISKTYQAALQLLKAPSEVRRVVLFLGSNVGNFSWDQAQAFCVSIGDVLSAGDVLLLGVDLRKNPRTILAAYDDEEGVTAAFNLNLLHRANRDLGANFQVEQWGFYPLYNPETGEVRSYLYPCTEQVVEIPSLNFKRTFATGEVIHTEVSRKYTEHELHELARLSGFSIERMLKDSRGYYADVVMVKN